MVKSGIMHTMTKITGDGYTLYHADCLDILPTLEAGSVDAVITDFPYGVDVEYGEYEDSQDNLKKLIADVLPELLRVANRVLFTCGIANVGLYPPPDWILSWAYSGGGSTGLWGFNVWQPVLVYGNDPYLAAGLGRRPDMIYRTEKAPDVKHPCPKPEGVWERLVLRASLPGHKILDPFMGSGTTGLNCIKTGRKFIGIELDAGYFQIAHERIANAAGEFVTTERERATGQLALWDAVS